MSRKKPPIDEIGKEIHAYLLQASSVEIKSDELSVVKVPVNSGYSHFVDISKLPDRGELPPLSERMREFAFRYATEYKPIKKWAKEFGVSFQAVAKWLSNPRVRQHIAYTRYERRVYNMAVWLRLEREALGALHNILQARITKGTIAEIRKTAEFILQLMIDPSGVSTREKGSLNLQIGFSNTGKAYENPYRTDFEATEEDIKVIEQKIEHLEMVARELEAEDIQYEVEE